MTKPLTSPFSFLSYTETITFGKYHKVHVCNLKEFKVFGGQDPDNLLLLLHAGLRNDTEPETFSLKHIFNDVVSKRESVRVYEMMRGGPLGKVFVISLIPILSIRLFQSDISRLSRCWHTGPTLISVFGTSR